MNLKGKRVFVTGAGGFFGSHLCSQLVQSGAKVTAMLHYNSRSDWSNLEFLNKTVLDSIDVIKGNIEDSLSNPKNFDNCNCDYPDYFPPEEIIFSNEIFSQLKETYLSCSEYKNDIISVNHLYLVTSK